MSIEIAGLVVSGISALSSVVQAYKAAREIDHELGSDEILNIVTSTTPTKGLATALAQTIDDKTLEVLLGNIEEEKNELLTVLGDRNKSRAEKNRAADRADKAICNELSLIKRYNSGELPETDSEDLYDVWERHGCK